MVWSTVVALGPINREGERKEGVAAAFSAVGIDSGGQGQHDAGGEACCNG